MDKPDPEKAFPQLISLQHDYVAYHARKEYMAWLAGIVTVGASTRVLFQSSSPWAHWSPLAFIALLVLFTVTASVLLILLYFQILRQRSADAMFKAVVETYTNWQASGIRDSDLVPTTQLNASDFCVPAAVARGYRHHLRGPTRLDRLIILLVGSWVLAALVRTVWTFLN